MSATPTATPGKTTTWQVDPAHTHVEFAVKHLMISTVRGRVSDCGLGWNQLLATGGGGVDDEVKMSIDAQLVAKVE